ncbi:MAG: ribosome maturation factor RimM [Rhodocyclaceae bacterium]
MIVLGRVGAPHGVRGSVHVQALADDPPAWGRLTRWWLGGGEHWTPYAVEEFRALAGGAIAKLEGVADRDAACSLGGLYIAAPRDALPAVGENECYWADLIGLEVVNLLGERLGSVTGILETGAHPVIEVSEGGPQRLLPLVEPIVREVDLETGRIRVDWDVRW